MTLTQAEREEAIDQYEAGPARLREALAKVPADALQWRPVPGEWSVHEIVVHCADSETTSASRIRYVLAEPEPQLVGYDQAAWAVTLDYHALPLGPALAAIDGVRANTAALLRTLPDAAWSRAGCHSESGRYAATDWLSLYAVHLHDHAEQIDANLAAWQAQGAARTR